VTTDDTAAPAPSAGKNPPAGSVFALGWLMAQLFGPLQRQRGSDSPDRLPTVAELPAEGRVQLALAELDVLLKPYPDLSSEDIKNATGDDGFQAAVKALHLRILEQFVGDHVGLAAYQLGRALSDTCWLPGKEAGAEFFLTEFGRYRLAALQTWLAEASGALAPMSAATVSRSLQIWQDWADVNASGITGGWQTANRSVVSALRTQGRVWHALLVGQTDISGQVGADAWVQAGRSVLHTARVLTIDILRRFWLVVVIIAAATGGLLYLAIANSTGTAKVWTSLVTVVAAFGVSGAGLRATAGRAVAGLEQSISRAAILDAQAWSVTWLPTLPQSRIKRYRLSRRGVAVPQAKPGLEPPS
jgi:hypothetical protein